MFKEGYKFKHVIIPVHGPRLKLPFKFGLVGVVASDASESHPTYTTIAPLIPRVIS
jgi:hypothetical protein